MLNTLSENKRIHLILNYPPLGLVRATAKLLGASGMAVETGCILLPSQAEVEVTLSYRHEGHNRVHRIPARVTRSEPSETLLEFDIEGQTAIHSLLGQPAPAAAHPTRTAPATA
ncbi:hypothetical protein [Thiohalomonas denitrificans]|uniref:PilZ domain-containing protein n=1 Tax=Thiohalomonas denitrificans TaxID=415747 RepID=A0A1G5PMZ6_9GAMM|nr:hypothetical protein [Thiohalomonas denitrificans]SCZ50833.1 hypothetical protein SAMN03097708_00509 [Thiohalomonas denitrificans]